MVGEKFGIGVDANYSNQELTYVDYGSDGVTQYDYTLGRSRAMVRTSWEFVNNERFQVNWANSFGYRTATWSYDSNEPGYVGDEVVGLNPIAFRTAIWFRVLFTENIGLNTDVGFGAGSLMNLGLTVKL